MDALGARWPQVSRLQEPPNGVRLESLLDPVQVGLEYSAGSGPCDGQPRGIRHGDAEAGRKSMQRRAVRGPIRGDDLDLIPLQAAFRDPPKDVPLLCVDGRPTEEVDPEGGHFIACQPRIEQ